MRSDPKKLLTRHQKLIHSELLKVESHVQRASGDWIINTVMVTGSTVPFRFKRKQQYRDLTGARVNLTYYISSECVAGLAVDVFNVVRIKIS